MISAQNLTTIRIGVFSRQVERRTSIILFVALAVLAILIFISLLFPGAGITTAEAIGVLFPRIRTSHTPEFASTVVTQWRLPRTTAAVVIGSALALSGTLMQVITRNPLGSPDLLGFNTGAYTGVILALSLGFGSFASTALAAFLGGMAAAFVVMAFAFRRGTSGLRLILTGLGVAMMLSALNKWLILRADIESSMSAAAWGAGSLNGLRWSQVFYANIVLITLIGLTLFWQRYIDALRLGDDTAKAIGVSVAWQRRITVAVAVALTASATALAGPISFVALAAAHITRLLTRSVRLPLLTTAAVGSCLLLASDIAAQRVFAPVQLPVGLITVALGGVYLLWLMRLDQRQ